MSAIVEQSPKGHRNAFGFLRLFFALLVIVSHAPELADGDRSREPLTQIFGTISFGELAVDAFFFVSGYLITQSYLQTHDIGAYIRKRVVRIYPAFLVCSAVCLVVVARIAGATNVDPVGSFVSALSLQMPQAPGTFASLPRHAINAAAWTIVIEFRCYLMVVMLGLTGLFKRPMMVAALAIFSYFFFVLGLHAKLEQLHDPGNARPVLEHVRLFSVFLTGSAFFLWRDAIRFKPRYLIAAVVLLLAGLTSNYTAQAAVAAAGGYLILFVAKHGKALAGVNNENDVSYGIYLYAWPIQQMVLLYFPGLPLLASGLLTAMLAYAAGWLSWRAVEKPMLEKYARTPSLSARADGKRPLTQTAPALGS